MAATSLNYSLASSTASSFILATNSAITGYFAMPPNSNSTQATLSTAAPEATVPAPSAASRAIRCHTVADIPAEVAVVVAVAVAAKGITITAPTTPAHCLPSHTVQYFTFID